MTAKDDIILSNNDCYTDFINEMKRGMSNFAMIDGEGDSNSEVFAFDL